MESESRRNSLSAKAQRFIERTDKFLIQDPRPGGIYNGIWCRDASIYPEGLVSKW